MGSKKRPPLKDLASHEFPYVTPPELADYLPCDRRTILRMIEYRTLRAYRVGRCWRIAIEEARRVFPVKQTSRVTP